MALNLEHRLDPGFRAEPKAKPPAGHRVSLRKGSAYHHSSSQFLGQLCGGERRGGRVSKIKVAFITDHPDVVFGRDFNDLLEFFWRNDSSCRVIWRIDNQQFCLRTDCVADR